MKLGPRPQHCARGSRPVISVDQPHSRKKVLMNSLNHIDHLSSVDSLPSTKLDLHPSGRYHALPPARLTRSSHVQASPRRNVSHMNIFSEPPKDSLHRTKSMKMNFLLAAQSEKSEVSLGKRHLNVPAAATHLRMDLIDASEPPKPRAQRSLSVPRTSSNFLHYQETPTHNERTPRARLRENSVDTLDRTSRVLIPSRLPAPDNSRSRSPFRSLCAADSVGDLLAGSPSRQRQERVQSIRTRRTEFEAPSLPHRDASPSLRHPVQVPLSSQLFNQDDGKSGRCHWDFKFSAQSNPTNSSLTSRRCCTPQPVRRNSDVVFGVSSVERCRSPSARRVFADRNSSQIVF